MNPATYRTCSWCHALNAVDPGEPTYCSACGHRVDVARRYCNCAACRRVRPARSLSASIESPENGPNLQQTHNSTSEAEDAV